MRIRQGNDFIFLWAIERNEVPEDFSNAENIRLHFKNFDCVGEVKSFQIVDGNIVRVEVSPEWASNLGAYRLILSYEFEDQSYSDGDQKCVVDVLAFNIVPKTSEADDLTEMAKTTDIMIGLKGDKGDPFTYDDFTPEQIEDLKRPAIEAAESVLIVENQISINEQGRVQSENERETAEATRVSNENNRVTAEQERVNSESLRVTAETSRETAEGLRVDAELLRQTNTQEAISNAENATENANTAAQNANDARGAIQDDLALKAFHGYASIEVAKTLKQVEDDTSVKIENLVVNGDFRNGIAGWTVNSAGGVSIKAVNNELELTISRTGKYNSFYKTSFLNKSDVYYTSIYSKGGVGGISLYVIDSGYAPTIVYPITSEYTRYSSIFIPNSATHRMGFGVRDGVAGDGYYFKNAITINLTTTFGAGNEPTKEEMDLLISTLGIDYFEGEITIPAQKIMQWQLAMIRQNRNAIIALGGTII